jgi:hypothetical protein
VGTSDMRDCLTAEPAPARQTGPGRKLAWVGAMEGWNSWRYLSLTLPTPPGGQSLLRFTCDDTDQTRESLAIT